MNTEKTAKKFIEQNISNIYITLKELCQIPAPSHFEQERAEYCKSVFRLYVLEYTEEAVHTRKKNG